MIGLIAKANDFLAGQPDELLTMALVFIGALLWIIAFATSPAVKAFVLLWVVLP